MERQIFIDIAPTVGDTLVIEGKSVKVLAVENYADSEHGPNGGRVNYDYVVKVDDETINAALDSGELQILCDLLKGEEEW